MPTRKPAKKKSVKKKRTAKKATAKKATAKKFSKKRVVVKTKAEGGKEAGKIFGKIERPARLKRQTIATVASPEETRRTRSGGQSGDLQGLSDGERADSESVDELLEEGNAFEADAVAGVEDADNADEKEVHTHEVPEDDVPGEYSDE